MPTPSSAPSSREKQRPSDEDPRDLLQRTLSTKPILSPPSNQYPTPQNPSATTPDGADEEDGAFRTIGLGSCGSVFEIRGTELAYKKGSIEASIWRDFCLTNRVHTAGRTVRSVLQNAFPGLVIPRTARCHSYHNVDDEEFWSDATMLGFPKGHRMRKPLFMVDRIRAVERETREALIELYFGDCEEAKQGARDDPDNKDCLVRIYLGERESAEQEETPHDSLRNFPLRLNMMEDIGLDTSTLAEEIAIGLAIMHWQAKIDAMDVEFVLGSSATWDHDYDQPVLFDDPSAAPHTVDAVNFKSRPVHLWMLDFDKASEISFTTKDVDTKLVPAFLGNDPYYPMPHVDRELWEEFSDTYIKASEVILRSKEVVDKGVLSLPKRFLDQVIRKAEVIRAWDEGDNVVFAD